MPKTAILLSCSLLFSNVIARPAAECQDGQVFPEAITALDKNTLAWPTPADVDFAKGALSRLGSYSTWLRGSLAASTSLDISEDNPAPGAAVYYLVKPTGPCSWQSTAGAEPRRDTEILLPCSVVHPTQEQIDGAAATSIVGLSNPWGNAEQFMTMYDRLQQNLACAVDSPAGGSVLVPSRTTACTDPDNVYCPTVAYCGEGNSSHGFNQTMTSGDCLNRRCFDHDNCYLDGCVATDCNFSPQSLNCDGPLSEACAFCPVLDYPFTLNDVMVCSIVNALLLSPTPASCHRAACDDQSDCTVDICDNRVCTNTSTCDDGNPCTDDSCDPATGCTHTNNNAVCRPPAGPCDIAEVCTNGSCPSDRIQPNGTGCDDGNPCTTNDSCSAGVCVGMPTNCLFLSVSAGTWHSCGVLTDGAVACWGCGYRDFGQCTPPAATFTSVSAGSEFSCGVRTDSTLACWGGNFGGQATPPAGTFLSVDGGEGHVCGVRTDGAVACWGQDMWGETTPPAGTFLSVSAGNQFSCGVRTDGTVACWGRNDYGQATPPPGFP